jgi:NADPH:quinone reductase-like Zn-dependent oxidoreductase
LIHAGSGGVGTLAIQIAKDLGAFVATTVSARNADLVTSLGADVVIDYKEQDFTDIITDYDVVFDMSGGDVMQNSFKVLKKVAIALTWSGLVKSILSLSLSLLIFTVGF